MVIVTFVDAGVLDECFTWDTVEIFVVVFSSHHMYLLLLMFYCMFYLRSSIIGCVFNACVACCLANVVIHVLRSYDPTREEA